MTDLAEQKYLFLDLDDYVDLTGSDPALRDGFSFETESECLLEIDAARTQRCN